MKCGTAQSFLIRSTGHFVACRCWASFHSRPTPAFHKMPVRSNVRHHNSCIRLEAPMRTLLAPLFALLLIACGGGGDQAGTCEFGPSACGGGTGSVGGPTSILTPFSQSGVGDSVFSLPPSVNIVRIQGTFPGSSSNFIVNISTNLVVNTIVGTRAFPQAHAGTYIVPAGGTVSITNSSGVSWSVSSTLAESSANTFPFSKTGTGDAVFDLPNRTMRYRIRATFPGSSSNFIVRAGGSLLVNELVGVSVAPSSFDGIFAIPAGARIEVRNSSGVSWNFTEV